MKRPFNFFIGNILWILFWMSVLHKDGIIISFLLLIPALVNIWIGMWVD